MKAKQGFATPPRRALVRLTKQSVVVLAKRSECDPNNDASNKRRCDSHCQEGWLSWLGSRLLLRVCDLLQVGLDGADGVHHALRHAVRVVFKPMKHVLHQMARRTTHKLGVRAHRERGEGGREG